LLLFLDALRAHKNIEEKAVFGLFGPSIRISRLASGSIFQYQRKKKNLTGCPCFLKLLPGVGI